MKDLVEATKLIYYIISKGQSPILEALHMKEKNYRLVSLQPAEESKQTDKYSSEHLFLLAMANSKWLEF